MKTTPEQRADLEAKALGFLGATPEAVLALLADLKEAEAETNKWIGHCQDQQERAEKAEAEVNRLRSEYALAEKFGWRPDAMGLALQKAEAERDRFAVEVSRLSDIERAYSAKNTALEAVRLERDKLESEKSRHDCMLETQEWRLQNDREWRTKLDYVAAKRDKLKADLAKAVEAHEQATGLLKAQLAGAETDRGALQWELDQSTTVAAALVDILGATDSGGGLVVAANRLKAELARLRARVTELENALAAIVLLTDSSTLGVQWESTNNPLARGREVLTKRSTT